MTRLREQAHEHDGIVDMVTWLNCATIDMIGELAFSEDFGSLDAGELRPELQKLFTPIKHFTFFKELFRLPAAVSRIFTAALGAFVFGGGVNVVDVGAEVSAKRKGREEVNRPDFMSYMLRERDSNCPG